MYTKDIIEQYYQAWIDKDEARARSFLDDDLIFRSTVDNFDSSELFMEKCWQFSNAFTELNLIHEVYDDNGGYIVYRLSNLNIGELIKIVNGKITAIYVTFNVTC